MASSCFTCPALLRCVSHAQLSIQSLHKEVCACWLMKEIRDLCMLVDERDQEKSSIDFGTNAVTFYTYHCVIVNQILVIL